MEIIPAIMPKSLEDVRVKTDMVYSYVKTVHVDVMDGSITHATCWPFSEDSLKEFHTLTSGEKALPHWKEVDFEVDVMMKDPEDSFAEWVNAGFKRVIIHVEATGSFGAIIHEWKDVVEIGAAINIETGIEKLQRVIADGVDFVQFMGIPEIGFQGTPFDERVIQKVADFHIAYPDIPISVDGAVSEKTIPALSRAGATRFVMGSAIYKASSDGPVKTTDIAAAISNFKKLAETNALKK